MIRKLLATFPGIFLCTHVHAFPCFITMIKDTCWSQYNVTVEIVDVSNQTVLTTLTMPSGKSWDRKEIACQPKQTVLLRAKYTPVFWAKDEDKVYYGKRQWSFPEEIKKGEGAWNMTICFARDMQEVSLPPESAGKCVCDMKGIPVIEPR